MARRLSLTLTTILFAVTAVWAQTPPASSPPPAPAGPPSLATRYLPHLSDLFGSDLPELDRPNAIKLTVRPHFGDLVHRDYMRMETGLRWALNDHFELKSAASVFFTHGLKGSAGYGIGELSGSAKYIFDDLPWTDYETSVELTPAAHLCRAAPVAAVSPPDGIRRHGAGLHQEEHHPRDARLQSTS
ncbi:MAG: hypothetical protein PSW75_05570 [bacterium]|nr:hypothetical protein [bacterium]